MEFNNIQSNFTAGEIGPEFLGRVELERYFSGVALLENMLVKASGGVFKRGGFRYISDVKDPTKNTTLVNFIFNDTYSYILEFGDLYIRVYIDHEQVQSGAVAYEIVTTYTEDEVKDLKFSQDSEVLYITHTNHSPATLTRIDHDSWTLTDIIFEFGYICGYEWEIQVAAANNTWQSVCWSPELTLFVAVSDSGTGHLVMTSPDGETWTPRIPSKTSMWRGVCWSPELTLFVAVSNGGAGVMTSPNGITWTSRTPAVPASWWSVCWSPERLLFVAVAYSGEVMTSPNGITWTSRTPALYNGWASVCWSPELLLFAAVAIMGSTAFVMTSPDGVTWTSQTSINHTWVSICWSPEVSMFVAVGGNGGVSSSANGIDWIVGTAATDNDWESVCWSPELALFVAVSSDGDYDRVMTSPDGIAWTSRTAENNTWNAVCWSPELLTFVAVASSGVSDFVMISKSTRATWTPGNYPALNWFYEQRHFFAATPDAPNKIWGSQSTEYTNMKLGTGADNESLEFEIKTAYKFLWVSSGDEITLGGSNAEFKLSANAVNEALTPSNVRPSSQTKYGGASIPPVQIDNSVLFVQRGRRKIRRLALSPENSGSYSNVYVAPDLTILNSTITKNRIAKIVSTISPESIVWAIRDDGVLIGLTYAPEHEVYGWHRHPIGGVGAAVKDIAVASVISGGQHDELWAIIEHTVNGSITQYIACMDEGLSDEDTIEDSFFIDAGVTKTGTGLTLVANLDHLEGEEVQILGDGAKQAPKIVIGGEITLDTAVDKVHVGLPYKSIIETLPIEGGNPVGTSQGVLKRISEISLRLYRSLGFDIGDIYGNLDTYYFGPGVMDEGSELFTGDTAPSPFAGSYDLQSKIRIEHGEPLPFNLLAIMYTGKTK